VRIRRLVIGTPLGRLTLTLAVGVLLCDGTLHPARRSLTSAESQAHESTGLSIQTTDKITLRAWLLTPNQSNTGAVILLHGLSDNRIGMTAYAELLLNHHYMVLQPDARAHGASGGSIATYGLLKRKDIREWFEWLSKNQHTTCIYALGESMGPTSASGGGGTKLLRGSG